MAFVEQTDEERYLEHLDRIEEQKLRAKTKTEEYAHLERMAKIKFEAGARATTRQKRISAIVKAPSIFVIAVWIPFLLLFGIKIPESVVEFIQSV